MTRESEMVINVLKNLRVGKIIEEYDLQDKIAKALNKAGISFEKEYSLGPGRRVDFLVSGGIAIEAKKGKPNRTRLLKQIEKYALNEEVKAIVIVVETSLKTPIGQTVEGKPCTVIALQKLWGIAL